MDENGDRNHDPHGLACLECDSDRQAVQKAVERQTARADPATPPVLLDRTLMTLERDGPIQKDIKEKAEGDCRHHDTRIDIMADRERFGHQVEEGNTEHRARTESQYQVQPIAHSNCEESSDHGSDASPERNRDDDERCHVKFQRQSFRLAAHCGLEDPQTSGVAPRSA